MMRIQEICILKRGSQELQMIHPRKINRFQNINNLVEVFQFQKSNLKINKKALKVKNLSKLVEILIKPIILKRKCSLK